MAHSRNRFSHTDVAVLNIDGLDQLNPDFALTVIVFELTELKRRFIFNIF